MFYRFKLGIIFAVFPGFLGREYVMFRLVDINRYMYYISQYGE
jgi:hypothetical protein